MTRGKGLRSQVVRSSTVAEVATRMVPFQGWRFAPELPLADVITPPYDVIGPEAQQRFFFRHPYNVVRVILPHVAALPGDPPDPYTAAAHRWRAWQQAGVLRRDEAPGFYVLRQEFSVPHGGRHVRVGIIGRFALRPWGEGILPHERTFPTAKADRLALLKATGVHFSPIFLLYSDPEGLTEALLNTMVTEMPVATFTDDDGVTHTLWRVTRPDWVDAIQHLLRGRVFYVADGHHRYETALAYRRWCRQQVGHLPSDPPFDYVLAYATAMEQSGVVILPTHRAIRNPRPVSPSQVLAAAARAYTVEPVYDDTVLMQWVLRRTPGEPALALVFPTGPAYRLRLRLTTSPVLHMLGTMSSFVAHLTVYHLQHFILGPVLGIPEAPDAQKQWVSYSPDAARLVREVRSGRWDMVALVAPTSIDQLRAIAEAGQVAPPKATYFYPKLPAGLVMDQVGPQ